MEDLIYLVIDIESNGPSVKHNSMFAIGCVAILPTEKRILGGFAYNIPEESNTIPYDPTMKDFWSKEKSMYDFLHKEQVSREFAATQIAWFVKELKTKYPKHTIMFASDCSIFDWKFTDDLLQNYVGNYILGYSGMDIYSYVAGAAHCARNHVWNTIEQLKESNVLWKDETIHDHDPYNDALHEAVLLGDVIRWNNKFDWIPLNLETRQRPTNSYWFATQ